MEMSVLFIWIFGYLQAASTFSPVSTLADCPKLTPQNDVKLNEISGTWRLGLLYMDDFGDFEEDSTCGVVEIMPENETKMELLLYLDTRKDEFTLDRYTKAFEVTISSPGEWLIRTSFKYLEAIYVTVIGAFGDQLILSFCANPFPVSHSKGERSNQTRPFFNTVQNDNFNSIFKGRAYGNLLKNFEGNAKKNRKFSGPFFRRKRYLGDKDDEPQRQKYEKFRNVALRENQKHLWTAILVRNNKLTALEYVENVSFLMKLGYPISKGQLVSFGSCSISK